mmetsp:Transcript_97058/g.302664  ORF Transcript_97058/g.302664 Transcript_97058/m.302664 type:complete len:166 (+) Transcript_97058:1436-1933(+)
MPAFAPGLAGSLTTGPPEVAVFLGFGAVARAPRDGALLGVHWQWLKETFFFQRPDPQRAPQLTRVQLAPARGDCPVPNATFLLTDMGGADAGPGQRLAFARYGDSPELRERTLTEWWRPGPIWQAAWEDAFTRVARCDAPEERCLYPEREEDFCEPRPCRLLGGE